MGMFHDFSRTCREDWKYSYKGQQLIAPAKCKLAEFCEAEAIERKKMSKLMSDMQVSASSKDVDDCKNEITHYGKLSEQCRVWVREFARTPDREFMLALGDVTFFDLHLTPDSVDNASPSDDQPSRAG
jgi:hypothetical protein